MRILLIEDDRELADYIVRALGEEQHSVAVCFDGLSGHQAARESGFDILILDVMLPHMDGFELTRKLREEGIRMPILLLTGRDSPEDVVRGLDAGADDYLTKPFSLDVLFARLRARTRPTPGTGGRLRCADLSLDFETREVSRAGTPLSLTRTEFSILECLMRSAGRVVPRDRLIEAVWGDRDVGSNNLDVFIRFLRTKIDTPGKTRLIRTERGVGYSLRENP
jgi:DNA-binding response OmpR family regulator